MKNFLCLIVALLPVLAGAQTPLYLPGATSGVNTTVNGNSNVGIGTNNPQDLLDVSGDIRIASRLKFGLANAAGGSYGVIGLMAGVPGKSIMFYNYDGPINELMTLNGATGNAAINHGGLTVSGNVGIGTTGPNAKLHVQGVGANKDAGNSNIFSGDFLIQANTGVRSSSVGAQLEFAIPANTDGTNVWGQARIITVAGNSNSGCACGKMIFGTRRYFDKSGSGMQWHYGDDLVIDAAGNVGVGSLNPDHKLTVKGKIHTEEVLVDLTVPGPDYVFEKDYNLLPLSELEIYITQNKHLPEVPSAKEMEADGLNLKQMNLILLKKVEELTLHLIEQQKQISKIDNENLKLKERLIEIEKRP